MIRKYIIIEADDSIKGFDEEIARLEREWGAEEIEPSEDCISRDAVITKIEDEDRLNFMGVFCDHDAAMGFRETIKELPSVTPSRPKGKWIHWTDDFKDYVTCSCCEYGEEGEVLLSDKTPFCPICGADMREGAE